MDLWQQHLADSGDPIGAPTRVTTGLDLYQAALIGNRIAYAKGRRVANVWRVHAPGDRVDRVVTWTDASQITTDQAWIEAFALSRNGRRLAVQSDRGGNHDIWLLPADGGDLQALTTDPSVDWWPDWSPDGQAVAFYSLRSGTRELWIQNIEGGPAQKLPVVLSPNPQGLFPKWSADGAHIFHGNGRINMTPVAGGETRVLDDSSVGIGTQDFAAARDGRWFAYAAGRLGERRIWRAPVGEGQRKVVTDGEGTAPAISPDGKVIYFTSTRGTGSTYTLERTGVDIWRVPSNGGDELKVTDLRGRRGFLGPNIATDGTWLYFTWREDVSDIWLMDVER
jgi:Tol biopolymer transport system component